MNIEQTRAYVTSAVWQAIAQSGLDLSALPQEAQQKFVARLSDALLGAVDDLLEQAQKTDDPAPAHDLDDGKEEKILWQGRPFLSLVESYVITSERLKRVKGMIGRDVENFELIRIQDIDLKQNVSERVLGIGDIEIRGADASANTVILRNIKDPEAVYETLRRAWLDARKRHGLQFREYM